MTHPFTICLGTENGQHDTPFPGALGSGHQTRRNSENARFWLVGSAVSSGTADFHAEDDNLPASLASWVSCGRKFTALANAPFCGRGPGW